MVRQWQNIIPAFEPIEFEVKKKRKWVGVVDDNEDSKHSEI